MTTGKVLPKKNQLIQGKYRIKSALGRGGAGKVYSATQQGIGILRALKFLVPERTEARVAFEKTFRTEVKNLAKLTHSNVIKIVDYDTWRNGTGSSIPFIVMEYADGPLSQAFDRVEGRSELIALLEQLLDGLIYIHERQMLHGDIKPANLLYQKVGLITDGKTSKRVEVKIGDLGVSKLVGVSKTPASYSGGQTVLWGSRKYSPEEVHSHLNEKKHPIKNSLLNSLRTGIDQFGLGVSIAEMISANSFRHEIEHRTTTSPSHIDAMLRTLKPAIDHVLSRTEKRYLERVIRRMTAPQAKDRYSSLNEARAAIVRITPQRVAFESTPELTGVGCMRKINHAERQVLFSERFFQLVNHPGFQRLHNLRQLDFLYNAFPGANHSRLSHSLEVYEIARASVLHLLNDDTFRYLVGSEDITLFLAAALLHSVGRFPMALAAEGANRLVSQGSSLRGSREFEHIWAEYFLKRGFGGPQDSLWVTLAANNVDPVRLLNIIAAPQATNDGDDIVNNKTSLTDTDHILCNLLDSAFDIDKLAYLGHDSRHTQIAYGKGVDVERLLWSLRVVLPEEYPQIRRPEIAISSEGLSALESVAFARLQMYRRVYWHRTNRAITAMIRHVLGHMFSVKGGLTLEAYIDETVTMSDNEALRWLAKKYSGVSTGDESSQIRGNLLDGLLDGSRRIHKTLTGFRMNSTNQQERLLYFSIDHAARAWDTANDLQSRIGAILTSQYPRLGDLGEAEVLIDAPAGRRKPSETRGLSDLNVLDEASGELKGATEFSDLARAIDADFDKGQPCRVFVSPRIRQIIEESPTAIRGIRQSLLEKLA